ncbi:hypothetical protein PILCRDRAFT_10941 [Piloderma croceum F 1598]|uniref:Uncharacterized protein n=1 Tax=Piloderma croceum (strain F 1598) TaxID=765440 RepID=A0A0C3FFY8_PILCF|nr:hypothetical protein PILCRDRAFT_10941 [Piloderma croceum F 1598]
MNTFDSYLLPPSTLDSANDVDDLRFLFQRPQTPLPTEPTYTDFTPSHLESALLTVLSGSPTDSINPMSMFYTSEGVAKVWDDFLQTNAKGRNGGFHAKDYYVVRAVSPYFMLDPTEPGAWFVTWPGTAGKDNPSGMSRLITGTPLCLKDVSVCAYTCADTLATDYETNLRAEIRLTFDEYPTDGSMTPTRIRTWARTFCRDVVSVITDPYSSNG